MNRQFVERQTLLLIFKQLFSSMSVLCDKLAWCTQYYLIFCGVIFTTGTNLSLCLMTIWRPDQGVFVLWIDQEKLCAWKLIYMQWSSFNWFPLCLTRLRWKRGVVHFAITYCHGVGHSTEASRLVCLQHTGMLCSLSGDVTNRQGGSWSAPLDGLLHS
jgi:hypothetical protein